MIAFEKKWQPTPVFLPGESQGWGKPGGRPSMGSHRVRHYWNNLAAAAAEFPQVVLEVKNLTAYVGNVRDAGSTPESERSPGGGYSDPLQYSCLENPIDREAWRATVHSVSNSWTWLKWFNMHNTKEKFYNHL